MLKQQEWSKMKNDSDFINKRVAFAIKRCDFSQQMSWFEKNMTSTTKCVDLTNKTYDLTTKTCYLVNTNGWFQPALKTDIVKQTWRLNQHICWFYHHKGWFSRQETMTYWPAHGHLPIKNDHVTIKKRYFAITVVDIIKPAIV